MLMHMDVCVSVAVATRHTATAAAAAFVSMQSVIINSSFIDTSNDKRLQIYTSFTHGKSTEYMQNDGTDLN